MYETKGNRVPYENRELQDMKGKGNVVVRDSRSGDLEDVEGTQVGRDTPTVLDLPMTSYRHPRKSLHLCVSDVKVVPSQSVNYIWVVSSNDDIESKPLSRSPGHVRPSHRITGVLHGFSNELVHEP